MNAFFKVLLSGCLLFVGASLFAGPSVGEDFATDPVASSRFVQLIFGTESSFTYNLSSQDLTAVLDVDYDAAYYLSAPFTPITALDDASFSFNFRVTAIDNRVLPTAYIGLVTTNHVALSGDGLTMALASLTNGQPAFSAAVDDGAANFGGASVPLALGVDYLGIGRHTSSNHQFAVEVYSGTNFVNLVGRSIAYTTNAVGLSVDRVGLQNSGGTSFDYTNGSITLLIDNMFVPARPPVNLTITTNVTVIEGNSGITNAIFTVALSSPSVQTVRVDYATVPLTATSGVDYLPQSGSLIFPSGTNSLTISVPIVGDLLAESDETFKVVLSNAVNANLVISEGVGVIQNDDICKISVNDAGAVEIPGSFTDAVFMVSLDLTNSQTVSVRYTTADLTATAGSDYIATNGLLIFPPGVMTQTFSVRVLGDNVDEPNEVFLLNLSNPTNAILGRTPGQCVITNTSPLPLVFLDTVTNIFEGNAATTNVLVTFRLTPASGKSVVVGYATSNNTAVAGSDYVATVANVTFNPGQTNVAVAISILGDRVHEALNETFLMTITSVSNAVVGNAIETVTIIDDDPVPSINIADTGVKEGNAGTTNAIFALSLSNPTIDTATVNFSTTNGTAIAGSDYFATNGVLTWLPGTTNLQFVDVPVIGDALNEPDETFSLVLDTPINAVLAKSQAICIITNDDFVTISISDAQVVEGNGGSTNMVFQVTLSGPSAQQVTVAYITKNGTATAGSDYLTNSGILTFTGNTSQTVTIAVLGDIVDEPDETFSVILTNLVNATFLKQVGTGTIIDDDPPAINISGVTQNEGDSNTTAFVFSVNLTSSSTNTITVNYSTADGTALAGSDYIATNGVLTFPPGIISASIPVFVIGDTNYELNEFFYVNLNGPTNATLGTGQALGTMLNDDPSPFVYVTNVVVVEGACTNIQITLSYTSTLPVTVHYCLTSLPNNVFLVCGTNCTVVTPTNVPPGCKTLCCQLIIPPGVLSTNFQICAEANGLDELDKDGKGTLDIPGGGGRLPADGGTNNVHYHDVDPPVIISANAGVVEGNLGLTNLCFPLRLTTPQDTNVSVDYFTLDGGARAGFDYVGSTGTVTFLPGVTNGTICIPVVGEIVYETNEIFFVRLTNAINGVVTNALLRGTITNDDLPPKLTIDDISVVEGNTGTTQAVFTVSVLTPTELGVDVAFTTIDVTATNGFDYFATNGTLHFNPGVTNLQIPVSVIGDTFDEPNETFFVRLSNPINSSLAKTNGVGTIIDDDPPEIRASNPSVVEGNSGTTNLLFIVSLSTLNNDPVTVGFQTAAGTATAGSDYIATNGVLTFLPGETNKIVPVTAIGDALTEVNETVFLLLTNAVNGTLPAPSFGTGTILDDDAPCISINNVMVQELVVASTNAVFLVTLDNPSSLDGSVTYSSSNGTAVAGSDYIGQSGTLIFTNGVTSQTISFVINNDLDVESNETFFVYLSTPLNVRICTNRGTGTIVDGTIPPVITVGDAVVVEGPGGTTTNAVFPVTMSRTSPQTVAFDIATTNGTATSGSDFTGVTNTMTLLPGTTSNYFTVQVKGDCSFEADEYYLVNLVNPRFAVLATNQVRGMITNDDPLPTILISDISVVEGDVGTTNASFKLQLSCPSGFPATVQYATMDGTATAGSDYVTTNGTATLPAGATNATISVAVIGDYNNESNEVFYVLLSSPIGATLATNTAVGTIINDDGILISIAPATGNEGSFAHFAVTLSKPPSSSGITVAYNTADLTANSGLDYDSTNGILSFAAGSTNANRTVDVFLRSDSLDEPNEYFYVVLTNPVHAAFATNLAVGAIIDGNPPCISVLDTNLADDGSGNQSIWFPVTLSSTSSLPICVSYYTTNGTALGGPDYIPVFGQLCFPPGSTNAIISVSMLPNTRDETNEYFFVILNNPSNATICKAQSAGTIVNPLISNAPPWITLTFPSNFICFTLPTNITLVADAGDPDGRINRVDFFDTTNKLGQVFAPPFALNLPSVGVGHHLLTAVALDNLGAMSTSAPVAFSASLPAVVSVDDRAVLEGNSGPTAMTFTVSLASPSCRTISLDVITFDQTAQAGSDYLPLHTNLTFLPDEISKSVVVSVLGDTDIESDEIFQLVITNEVNCTVAKRVGLATIINDDTNRAPTVSIVSPTNNAVFYAPPGIIPILANAQDPDGFIAQVDFLAGTNFIGRSTNSPFAMQWANSVLGIYDLMAIATDNDGVRATSGPVRMAISVCSGSLTATPLLSQTVCACGAVSFSTTVTSPEPVSFLWRLNGRQIPGAISNSITLYSLTSAHAGLYSVEASSSCRSLTNTATLQIEGENLSNPMVLSSSGSITINDNTTATPYPAPIYLPCVPGPLTNLSVTISGLTHTFLGDVDIVLVSPTQRAIKLISDVGEDAVSASDITLTFKPDAAQYLPPSGDVVSGTYLPTDYVSNDGNEVLSQTTGATYTTNLADFVGSDPSGIWGLYVRDDQTEDAGEISGGWSMTVWWADIPPRLLSPVFLQDGRFQMTLLSQPNRTHFIEASTDLEHWSPIKTVVMVGTDMQITLSDQGYPVRFYRARRCPGIDIFQSEPVLLYSPKYLGDGWFQMMLHSAAGRTHVIEASTDLHHWTPVSTNTMTASEMLIVVPGPKSLNARFYRAVTTP